jgi:large subunit ribosomal protein L19
METFYEMYSPIIQKIEVLRLERRLDSELLYLRDALPEYSTFPLDMEPEFHPEGSPVPVNPIKVSNSTIMEQ